MLNTNIHEESKKLDELKKLNRKKKLPYLKKHRFDAHKVEICTLWRMGHTQADIVRYIESQFPEREIIHHEQVNRALKLWGEK